MREDLIAYALGELDDADKARVEALLANDPELRDELAQIECCLQDSEPDDCECLPIPRGLADRTTATILTGCQGSEAEQDILGDHRPNEYGSLNAIMSPMDMTVAIGILITVGCLLLPAIYSSRNQSQHLSCMNNLGHLGKYMTLYADNNHDFYPVVRPYDHTGMFATRLREADLTTPYELDRLMVCPSSRLAERMANTSQTFHVPSMADLALADGQWLEELKRNAAGSYAYQAGYVRGKFYFPAKNMENSRIPVLSDAPSCSTNFRTSDNHGGQQINVLFQDGHVSAVSQPLVPQGTDHLFLNNQGLPSVSDQWNDAVLLPSQVTPGVQFPVQPLPQVIHRFIIEIKH